MKKFLSLFLSIVMLFSITAGVDLTANAAATQISGSNSKSAASNIEFSKEYALVLTSGATKWFKFKTKNNGNYWYNISVNNVSVGNNNGFAGVNAKIYDYFDEEFVYASSFNSIGEKGAKLEPNSTYYVAIWGVRAGTIKFKLDSVYDNYGEKNSESTTVYFDRLYESTIDSRGSITDDRVSDMKNGDVDVVKFNSNECEKIRLTLSNSDIEYYNSYFEGLCGIVSDSFGQTLSYIEVRPDSTRSSEFSVKKIVYIT